MHPQPPTELQEVEQKKPSIVGPAAGVLGVIGLILLKFKGAAFIAFKALSLVKLGWLLKGFSSMALSLGIYMMMFGWKYAVTIIILLFIHEMGHFIFMHFYGLKPRAPMFVPFVGAYTAMTHIPRDLATHAWVAYAGPFIGGIAAFASYLIGVSTGNTYLVAAANTGAILNLLQLVPIKPFDGGFIAQSITRWLFIPGAALLAYLAWTLRSPLLILIAVVAIFVMISQIRKGADPEEAQYPATPIQRIFITISYIGLAVALTYLFMHSHIRAPYGHP
jgi:Zn-dependent protease